MERESFVFYISWLEGIKRLPIKMQKQIKIILLDYCAYGIEPNLEEISPEVFMAFTFAKPQIDANNRRYLNGLKGGSRQGLSNNPNGRKGKKELPMVVNQETTKELPMVVPERTTNGRKNLTTEKLPMAVSQRTTKELPNVNDNVNDNVNVNDKEIANATKKEKRAVFQRPTLDEIKSFIKEKNYTHVDAEKFYDFYESKNWMVGKNKMSKWKSAVANWERTEKERSERKRFPNMNNGVILQNDKDKFKNEKEDW